MNVFDEENIKCVLVFFWEKIEYRSFFSGKTIDRRRFFKEKVEYRPIFKENCQIVDVFDEENIKCILFFLRWLLFEKIFEYLFFFLGKIINRRLFFKENNWISSYSWVKLSNCSCFLRKKLNIILFLRKIIKFVLFLRGKILISSVISEWKVKYPIIEKIVKFFMFFRGKSWGWLDIVPFLTENRQSCFFEEISFYFWGKPTKLLHFLRKKLNVVLFLMKTIFILFIEEKIEYCLNLEEIIDFFVF